MPQDDIIAVIELIQNFGIAADENILYAILPSKTTKKDFSDALQRLEKSGKIKRIADRLFLDKHLEKQKSKKIARSLFQKNNTYLKLCSRLPWVRFISLTGTNAYEFCHENDDIDLFVISAPNRLWILYVLIVIVTKTINRRPLFCFNYLIDENNLSTPQKTYHNAIQLYMMKPLLNANYKKQLLKINTWIKDYLPNAEDGFLIEEFYRLRPDFKRANGFLKPLDWLNAYIFNKYKTRLSRKFPASLNRGMHLSNGIAKLHMRDKSALYDNYMNLKNT